jgi:hypothetical protein
MGERKNIVNKLCLLIMVVSFFASPGLPEDACKVPVAKTTKAESPLACNRLALNPAERRRHFEVLGPALMARKTGVRELPAGYEFSFPSDAKTFAMLSEWIEQERRCCPFFDFDLRVEHDGGAVWLRLTGRPGTKEVIRSSLPTSR